MKSVVVAALAAALAVLSATARVAEGAEASAVCVSDDGVARWTAAAAAPTGEPVPLLAEPWFPRVPAGAFAPLGTADPDPPPLRGGPALIDFWASWCGPCLEELPHLESIRSRLAPRGLRVVAANVDDPADVARETATRLGIGVELASPSEALNRAVRPRSLPTLVLVDGAGRIRGRWDGYRPGIEADVFRAAEALLDEGGRAPAPIDTGAVATVGAGRYRVRWIRELVADIDGVAIDPGGEVPRVLASSGRDLHAFDPDGRAAGRVPAPPGTGRLLVGDVTGDGRSDVVGWRPAAIRVGVLDLAERVSASWDAEAPVFGVAVLAPGAGPAGAPLALATSAGLRFHAGDGGVLARSDGPARSVAAAHPDGLSWLDDDGAWIRLDRAGVSLGGATVGPDASGILSVDVCTVVTREPWADPARARGASSDGVAMVAAGRDLVVMSIADGSTVWRSAWSGGIAQVATGDLDGDGVDEIVVASGKAVLTLERDSAPADVP